MNWVLVYLGKLETFGFNAYVLSSFSFQEWCCFSFKVFIAELGCFLAYLLVSLLVLSITCLVGCLLIFLFGLEAPACSGLGGFSCSSLGDFSFC